MDNWRGVRQGRLRSEHPLAQVNLSCEWQRSRDYSRQTQPGENIQYASRNGCMSMLLMSFVQIMERVHMPRNPFHCLQSMPEQR